MAEQVDVKIITVDAVNNLADLKKAIKDAKDNLSGMALGSEKYQEQLKEVIKGQNLLRSAMNGTKADAEQLKDAVDENGKSYNALVNQMANLTRAFRATTDAAERANLAGQIKEINTQLKDFDSMRGNYSRNVGDYFNQTSAAMKEVIKDLPSQLDKIKGPLRDIEGSMGLMSKHPIIGILGLLAPLIAEIAKGVKENENAMEGVKKIMDSLKPVMDFFSGILENVVVYVGDLINQAATFLGSSGIFNQIVKGVMGVGNAILQFVIAPFKAVGAAVKVFKEQGIKGIGDAARAMNEEFTKGVAFKQNFQSGQAFADTIVAGAKSRKKEVREAGKEIAKEFGKGLEEELDTILDRMNAKWEKRMEERQKLREKRRADVAAYLKEQADEFQAEQEEEAEHEAEVWLDAYKRETEAAKEAAKQKMATMTAYASGVSSLTSSLADILENEGKEAKNLRIAAATIDMISGAVTAFSTAQQLGPIAGPIVGAINAAAVVASGLANIAKIRSTNVSKNSTPSTNAPEAPTVSAPVLETAVPTTTVVNGASTEAALNRAGDPQKVYILQSDIEAAGDTSRVQVAESSF